MWNHFHNIGERPRTTNHLEDYHRQLNARVRTNPMIYRHGLMKLNHPKNLSCAVMSRNKHNDEQQDQEKENTYEIIINSCWQRNNLLKMKIICFSFVNKYYC
jgi:hypothetical protein